MRKQVSHAKTALVRIVAPLDVDNGSVGLYDNAMESQRNSRPLVLLETAIVVGLEKSEPVRLVQRIGLEVDSRRIDVGNRKTRTVLHAVFADYGKRDRLAAVNKINHVTRLVFRLGVVLGKAFSLCLCESLGNCLTLYGRSIEKALIALAELVRARDFVGGERLYTLVFTEHNALAELLGLCFFF